jgi:rfaE bifunctional protein kinase chain/domain
LSIKKLNGSKILKFSEHISDSFAGKKIVILGDLVADQFLNGTISRVSREAPVFILRHDETVTVPGGAANAAANVASLGGKAVSIGIVGKDVNGEELAGKLAECGVDCSRVVIDPDFRTTTKVRVIGGEEHSAQRQLIRIDFENRAMPAPDVQTMLRKNLEESVKDADAVIISDYNYGVVTPELAETAIALAKTKGIPVLVDSRFRLQNYPGATSATPNQEEAEALLGKNFGSDDCSALVGKLGYESLLVTLGSKGMLLIEKNRPPVELEAVGPKTPVDVTGAGDTVIAAYALGLASGLSFADAARIANHAGGIVVMKKGTATVGISELIASLEQDDISRHKAQTQ